MERVKKGRKLERPHKKVGASFRIHREYIAKTGCGLAYKSPFELYALIVNYITNSGEKEADVIESEWR
jgi:hypothetical protein